MRFQVLILTAAVWTLVTGAHAADPPASGYDLGATVTAGYRTVDIDGSKDKYLEDYNLRSGGRLFLFDASGTARAPDTAPLDRFRVLVSTPGDEPVSTFHLDAANTDAWDLRANFVRSKYFYAVPQLFENPVPGNARTDDLHTFDQIRTNGTVDFRLTQPGMPTLFFGYRLYRREGDAISTLAIPGGDTFTFRNPEDVRAHVGRVGTEFRALGTWVYLAQEYRQVIRDFGGHGPLASEAQGVDPTDAATLGRYTAFGSEQSGAPTTIVRLRRAVGSRLDLTGNYLYSHATLDADWTSRQTATLDTGVPFDDRRRRDADATLDTHVADLGATYRVTDGLRLHATYRFDERAQRGDLDDGRSGSGALSIGTGHHLRLHRVTVDAEVQPRSDLTVRVGARTGWRDANLSSGTRSVSTTTVGAIADVRYRPSTKIEGFLRYESAQVDDPYVSAGDALGRPVVPGREIAYTFTNRGSAGVTVRPWTWMRLGYRFVADSRENASFDGRQMAYGNSVTLSLTPLPNLTASASYAFRDLDNRADVLPAPRFAATTSLQSGTEEVFLTQLAWDFSLIGQRWTTGWNLTYFDSNQALRPRLETVRPAGATVFDIDRVDGGLFLTWHHAWIEPSIEVRRIEHTERDRAGNDYRATIVALSLTRRFGSAAAADSEP
jgi:hypothetical protein